MSSIRYDLLSCLLKHGEQTIDDLELQLQSYPRKTIYNNLQPAKSDKLISSKRGLTGLPSYRLTDNGVIWLQERGTNIGAANEENNAAASPDEIADNAETVADADQEKIITISISGPIGTGKTAIARAIDKTLSDGGTPVRFDDVAEADEARNLTFGELNEITAAVIIRVEHELPVCCGAARVMATTAAEVSGEYRSQLESQAEQTRLLTAENSALRQHSLMLGQIAAIVYPFDETTGSSTLDVVETMVKRIADLESAVDLAQQTIHQQELESEQHKERIATLESNGDLLATSSEFVPDEVARLQAENTALKTLNNTIPGFGATYEAIMARKPPFYVSIGRDTGPQIHKDIEVATRRMKSIVRRGDKAGLVLVPILKAIQGVEIVEVKAA